MRIKRKHPKNEYGFDLLARIPGSMAKYALEHLGWLEERNYSKTRLGNDSPLAYDITVGA